MMIRIGIVGSRQYTNKERVSHIIDMAIKEFGHENLTIVSGGARGADTLGKNVALEKQLTYEEYNPAHENHNEYSVLPERFFNKPYNPGNYFERNSLIAESVDYLIAFVPEGVKSNGTMDTVRKVKKLGKPVRIIN